MYNISKKNSEFITTSTSNTTHLPVMEPHPVSNEEYYTPIWMRDLYKLEVINPIYTTTGETTV